MKRLVLAGLSALLVFGCTSGGGKSTENFGTATDAQTAATQNSAYIQMAAELALLAVDEADFDGSFDGMLFLKQRADQKSGLRKPLDGEATYNSSTGWWTFEETETETEGDETLTTDVLLKLRFTERDIAGLATANTDMMEYTADASATSTSPDASFVFSYDADLTFTGLAGYNAETGSATLNGSSNMGFEISAGSGAQSFTYEFRYEIDYHNITFSHDNDYPEGGGVDFTVELNLDPNVPGVDEYYVAGTITFDGDNTALLHFGGYNFIINLDTGVITAA